MVRLYDADTEAEIGQISEAQLDVMIEQLVAITGLESGGADAALVSILRRALGTRASLEVRYEVD